MWSCGPFAEAHGCSEAAATLATVGVLNRGFRAPLQGFGVDIRQV